MERAKQSYEGTWDSKTNKPSQWGLALTYYLFGRLYIEPNFKDLEKAKDSYTRATECFQQILHYRGLYVTAQDLLALDDEEETDNSQQKELLKKQKDQYYTEFIQIQ